MECPKCKKEIKIPDYVFNNVETYGYKQISISECCKYPFIVSRVITFKIIEYTGERKLDDWGEIIKK